MRAVGVRVVLVADALIFVGTYFIAGFGLALAHAALRSASGDRGLWVWLALCPSFGLGRWRHAVLSARLGPQAPPRSAVVAAWMAALHAALLATTLVALVAWSMLAPSPLASNPGFADTTGNAALMGLDLLFTLGEAGATLLGRVVLRGVVYGLLCLVLVVLPGVWALTAYAQHRGRLAGAEAAREA